MSNHLALTYENFFLLFKDYEPSKLRNLYIFRFFKSTDLLILLFLIESTTKDKQAPFYIPYSIIKKKHNDTDDIILTLCDKITKDIGKKTTTKKKPPKSDNKTIKDILTVLQVEPSIEVSIQRREWIEDVILHNLTTLTAQDFLHNFLKDVSNACSLFPSSIASKSERFALCIDIINKKKKDISKKLLRYFFLSLVPRF